MDYRVKIEVDAEEVVKQLGVTELMALANEIILQYFDIHDLLEIARKSFTDEEILKEMDLDDIIEYIRKEGYVVND